VRHKTRVAEISNSDTILVRGDLTHDGNIMLRVQQCGVDSAGSKLNPELLKE